MENIEKPAEQPKWYVIHTYSGYENSVETDLRNMIENNNLHDYIFDIKIPVEDDIVERNVKKKVIQRKKFPSYVFIKMIYTSHIWFMVTRPRGVTSFVGSAGRPIPLTDEEIRRIIEQSIRDSLQTAQPVRRKNEDELSAGDTRLLDEYLHSFMQPGA